MLIAEGIANHRLEYLDYEGPVSRERGLVQRWDSGDVEWLEELPQTIRLKLYGSRLRGELKLTQAEVGQVWSVGLVR